MNNRVLPRCIVVMLFLLLVVHFQKERRSFTLSSSGLLLIIQKSDLIITSHISMKKAEPPTQKFCLCVRLTPPSRPASDVLLLSQDRIPSFPHCLNS